MFTEKREKISKKLLRWNKSTIFAIQKAILKKYTMGKSIKKTRIQDEDLEMVAGDGSIKIGNDSKEPFPSITPNRWQRD